MKKIISIILCLLCMITLFSGCGNMSIGMGEYDWEHIHFTDYKEGYCGTIEKWYDVSTGIEVKTREYGSLFLAEGCYTLIADEDLCPWCK